MTEDEIEGVCEDALAFANTRPNIIRLCEYALRLQRDRDALLEACENLLAKLDAIHLATDGIFAMAAMRGMPYTGPNWVDEKDALVAAMCTGNRAGD